MSSRKETERTKLMQEKCQTLLTQMLRDEDNKYCVDCDAKGPRWASWNLGVFLCIRCAGIHRNLGVHISRVKSVNLDTWTPEQVVSLQQMGNSRARAVYEAQLPDGFRRPQTDTALESFIRAKYEHKKYLAREWVPPSPPKVDWAKEIDEEIEKQKRKKKANQIGGISAPLSSAGHSIDKKLTTNTSNSIKNTPLPAPLPKPKSANSPKTSNRIDLNVSTGSSISKNSDLLGLSSPTSSTDLNPKDIQSSSDQFTGFLSATGINGTLNQDNKDSGKKSLAKEEEDFFNQTTSLSANDRDKSGKLTKDSILALYGTSGQTSNPNSLGQFNNNPLGGFSNTFNHQNYMQQQMPSIPNQQQHQQTFPGTSLNLGGGSGLSTNLNLNLAGMPQGLLGPPHQVSQTVHPHQFMQPPSSMYNAPVMTAPTAFTAAGSGSSVPQYQQMGMQQQNFGQFPSQNFMGANNLQSNIMFPGSTSGMQSHPMSSFNTIQGTMPLAGQQNNSSNLSQQFGNLNLGNVWQ